VHHLLPIVSTQLAPRPAPRDQARSKLRTLQDKCNLGFEECFRCDDSGHSTSTCKNSIVCFSCNRLGHRSHQCRSITMFQPPPPQPTPQALAMANRLPVL
jgi:Zinc knuckle